MSLPLLPLFNPHPLLVAAVLSLVLLWAALTLVTQKYPSNMAAPNPESKPDLNPSKPVGSSPLSQSQPPSSTTTAAAMTPAQPRPIPTSTVVSWRASFSLTSSSPSLALPRLSDSVMGRKGSSSGESLTMSEGESLYSGSYSRERALVGVGEQFVVLDGNCGGGGGGGERGKGERMDEKRQLSL